MSDVRPSKTSSKSIESEAPTLARERQRAAASRARRRAIRRRRSLGAVGLACLLGAIGVAVSAISGSGVKPGSRAPAGPRVRPPRPAGYQRGSGTSRPGPTATHAASAHGAANGRAGPAASTITAPAGPPYAIGIVHLRLVDTSRTVVLPGGVTGPRTLLTGVRYPAIGRPGSAEHPGATPAEGPFPLIVFGHGFAVTLGSYARLLDAWAAAGYVVAAPTFPLSNAHAPGAPNERDLPNQPPDIRFVITRLLAADAATGSRLHGMIERREIAVAGQSDGGDTALAVAYDPRDRDPRISAAVILSGAYDPFVPTFSIAPGGPPLLATQGTADQVNLPSATAAFYDSAPVPKYLLQLLGAGHLPPYTNVQPQLAVVERTTLAFFDEYLKHESGAARRLGRAGNVAGIATFSADR